MADRKPPRLDADERTTLVALWQFQRESLVRKTEGLDDDHARRRLVPTPTTLIWLLRHLARAEVSWVLNRFAGLDLELPPEVEETEDTLEAAVAAYRATWSLVDEVVATAASLDEPCRGLGDEPAANLRWVVTHLLEETARHAGHADILRELIDGSTGR